MQHPPEGYKPLVYHLTKWDLDAALVRAVDGGVYFLVTPLCEQLKLQPARQRQKLQADFHFEGHLIQLPIKTDYGKRMAWCLRRNMMGRWFDDINPKRLPARFQDHLKELSDDLTHTADRAIWNDVADVMDPVRPATVTVHRAKASINLHGQIEIVCECGRAIKLTLDGDQITIESGHEVGP